MNKSTIITGGKIVNEGKIVEEAILIKGQRIEKIAPSISLDYKHTVLDVEGKLIIPGIIDDQVHFRDPGLTHKATIFSESRSAVKGGVTSFMEMPNTIPNTLTQELLEEKFKNGEKNSLANYSFFMGGSNDNYDQVMKTDLSKVCGLKLFMGSSTGNMLVDNEDTLDKFFRNFPGLIATHCEDENIIKQNTELAKERYSNGNIPYDIHPQIRNIDACYSSSSYAVSLAKKNNTRLHVLHISTVKETDLFDNSIPLKDKKITSEVCVHHLYFDASQFQDLGNKIKCNPAIKHDQREGLMKALLENKLDIIATDHAPHLISEKEQDYWNAPAGLPLVQHSLTIMLDFYHRGLISLEKIVEKMSHSPAECFKIKERGFLREGYFADLAVVDPNKEELINKENILYKCEWSPLEGKILKGQVTNTIVSGNMVYNGKIIEGSNGLRLEFNN